MNIAVRKIPGCRIIPNLRNWGKLARPRMTTMYAFAAGSAIFPITSHFSNQNKEIMEETKINCPIHCYHEPLHEQVEKMKEEVRPRSLVQCFVVAIQKIGSCFHLVLRAIQIMVVFSPAVFSSWLLCFPHLRTYWYHLLVATLQIAGSSFMKLGQWAATRPDILPLDLCKQLSTLHSTAKCLDFPIMLKVIERELGKPAYDVFDEIIEDPIGSGCIAQVYKARIRNSNDWVAIKVKRPEVDTVFSRDLQLVNFITHVMGMIPFMQYMEPVDTGRLFTKAMRQQLDFRVEAINLIHFNENFRDDDQFVFPHPYLNLTTPSLLVESFEDGIPLSTLLSHPSPKNSTIAHLGILGFLHMLLVDNFLHADLHPGNILVRENVQCQIPLTKSISHSSFGIKGSHPQLIFLDTGLVTIMEDSQKNNFIDLFIALAHGDGHKAGELLVTRAPQPSPPVIDPEGFMNEIKELVDDNMDNGVFNLSKLEIADALTRMLSASLTHHVTIDSRFVNLFMSVIILEGVGRQLDKNLNIITAALPIMSHSLPEFGEAAVNVIKDSKFARKSLSVSIRTWIENTRKLKQEYKENKMNKEHTNNIDNTVEENPVEMNVDERGAALIQVYDRVEKQRQ